MIDDKDFAFHAIEHYGIAQIVFAFFDAGVWGKFEAEPDLLLDTDEAAKQLDLDARLTLGLSEYLSRRGVLEQVAGSDGRPRFKLSPRGRELVLGQWLGYFVHIVGGYGNVLQNSAAQLRKKIVYGPDIRRDGYNVALASELIGRNPHHASYKVAFERSANLKPEMVMDLGCGSAAFLLDLVRTSGAKRGVGVDMSAGACDLARQNVKTKGYADRVKIIESDARQLLEKAPELDGAVDLISAMFIVHEFFSMGFSAAAGELRELCRALKPETGRILILDKIVDGFEGGAAPGFFTEFKLVHDLTSQVLTTKAQWQRVLDEAGLEVLHEQVLGVHSGTIVYECRRK